MKILFCLILFSIISVCVGSVQLRVDQEEFNSNIRTLTFNHFHSSLSLDERFSAGLLREEFVTPQAPKTRAEDLDLYYTQQRAHHLEKPFVCGQGLLDRHQDHSQLTSFLGERGLPACTKNNRFDLPPNPCDDPDVRNRYTADSPQSVRLIWHIPRESDGSNPLVSPAAIAAETLQLNTVLQGANLQFDSQIHYVSNSALRHLMVESSCYPGNNQCESDCYYSASAWDAGDCDAYMKSSDTTRWNNILNGCSASMKGNGVCELACNYKVHNWDGGDCCDPRSSGTKFKCLDPNSPNRIQRFNMDQYKEALVGSTTPSMALNVFATEAFTSGTLLGQATFPVESNALGSTGGFIALGSVFTGTGFTNAHELGHCMGLWHVFTGVSEVGDCLSKCSTDFFGRLDGGGYCDSLCIENIRGDQASSDAVGDLLADTPSTPRFWDCDGGLGGSSSISDYSDCNGNHFSAGSSNIMDYTDCDPKTFSPQQLLRIRCSINQLTSSWLGTWSGTTASTTTTKATTTSSTSTTPTRSTASTSSTTTTSTASTTTTSTASTTTTIPSSWKCPVSDYDDGLICNCGCGAFDPDCVSPGGNNPGGVPILGCYDGKNPTCDANGNCIYSSTVPASWICNPSYYDDGSCDCECSTDLAGVDPDCSDPNLPIYNCAPGAQCIQGTCVSHPPPQWTCDPTYYGALDGCDCNCGAPDPDCLDAINQWIVYGCSTINDPVCVNGACQAFTPGPIYSLRAKTSSCFTLAYNYQLSFRSDGVRLLQADNTQTDYEAALGIGSQTDSFFIQFINSTELVWMDLVCSGYFPSSNRFHIDCQQTDGAHKCSYEYARSPASVQTISIFSFFILIIFIIFF